jgi:hypothetical protein
MHRTKLTKHPVVIIAKNGSIWTASTKNGALKRVEVFLLVKLRAFKEVRNTSRKVLPPWIALFESIQG